MSSYSLTILGSDFIGLSLAQTFLQEHEAEKISLIGQIPNERQNNDLQTLFNKSDDADLSRFPEAFEGEDNIGKVVSQTLNGLRSSLGFVGGELVDLKVDTDGFVMLVRRNEELEEIFTHHLVVTAPPVLDIVEDSLLLPGTDSAVTGLLLDKTGVSINGSNDFYVVNHDGTDRIWDFDFGFEVNEMGGTSNMKISSTGQAAESNTTAETLKELVDGFEELPEPNPHYNESFDKKGWEDTSMPEGFVETKTQTLRELMSEVVNTTSETEALTQKLEGLAGEVDSYSRFRSDPDLQRLRWKTLTAMNFAQSFLTQNDTVTA